MMSSSVQDLEYDIHNYVFISVQSPECKNQNHCVGTNRHRHVGVDAGTSSRTVIAADQCERLYLDPNHVFLNLTKYFKFPKRSVGCSKEVNCYVTVLSNTLECFRGTKNDFATRCACRLYVQPTVHAPLNVLTPPSFCRLFIFSLYTHLAQFVVSMKKVLESHSQRLSGEESFLLLLESHYNNVPKFQMCSKCSPKWFM